MGCIRKEWEIKILGDICETSSGGTPSKSHPEYYEDGNIPWLRSGEISQGHIYETELYITEEGLNKSSAKIFPIDTVVIAMYGATVGQVGILKKEMSTNQAVCGIFPTPMLSPLFLVYYLKAKKPYFLSLAAGGAQPNISQNIIKSTPIPVPPLAEQEKIVAELDCLSGIIEKKKQQLKEYDALAQSIFYEMFGDPVENEKGWEVKKWGDLFETILGKMLDKKKQVESDKILPYIGNINVQWGYFELKDLKTMTFSDKERVKLQLKPDDILICEGGDAGRCAVWNGSSEEILFQKAIHRARVKKGSEIIPQFASFLLKEIKLNNGLKDYISKSTIEHLTGEKLSLVPIIFPPLALQQQFSSKIEAIEKQKALIKKSIEEVETLFNSRMDYYFN